jgi:putative ABC transport system substrate-binding protein
VTAIRRLLIRSIVAIVLLLAEYAAAQPRAAKVFQVGWLQGGSRADYPEMLDAFKQGLRESGWIEDRNVTFVYRFAEGKTERLPQLAAELVRAKVDAIVATAPGVVAAARKATSTIPIVMVYGPDPVAAGLVASLASPGGNITGLTSLSDVLSVKQLGILQEIVPAISHVGLLWNPTNPWHAAAVQRIGVVAQGLGLRVQSVRVTGPDEFDAAVAAVARNRAGAILTLPDPMTLTHRAKLANLAMKYRLPTMNGLAAYTEAGGLVSYWPASVEMFRRAAGYVDKIFKGSQPGDLPIEQPTKFDLVVNLKTAKVLGLTIPAAVLAQADRIIEE